MCRIKVSAFFGPLFLSILLVVSITFTRELHAQATGASIAVRMIDGVDSSADPAGKQYRASVTTAVNAGNGVTIPQGAAAMVSLASSGSGYIAQLSSVSINGQPVAVTSSSASVTTGAQSAAGNAVSSINSALSRFGHHVKPPAAATAIAMGQRVVLPPGTTLTFVLSQPPAPSGASPAAPGMAVASAPSVPQPAQHSSVPVAAPGRHWWFCQFFDPIDVSKPVLGKRIYFSVFPSSSASRTYAWPNYRVTALDGDPKGYFNEYVQQNYKIADTPDLAADPYGTYNGHFGGYCRRTSDDAAGRANSMDMRQKQWASSKPSIEAVQVDFADTAAQDAAIEAKLAAAPSAPPPAAKPSSSNPNAAKCAALIAQGQKPPPYCSQ